jgi:hypothetical protein
MIRNPLTKDQLQLAARTAQAFSDPDSTREARHEMASALLATRPDLADHDRAIALTTIFSNAVAQLHGVHEHAAAAERLLNATADDLRSLVPPHPSLPANDTAAWLGHAVRTLYHEQHNLRELVEQLRAADRRFPIMGGPSILWSVIAPHESQAKANHSGQSLARLAERGGLDQSEAVAVLEGLSWTELKEKYSKQEAHARFRAIVERTDAEQSALSRRASQAEADRKVLARLLNGPALSVAKLLVFDGDAVLRGDACFEVAQTAAKHLLADMATDASGALTRGGGA